jgi:hypothetical protein
MKPERIQIWQAVPEISVRPESHATWSLQEPEVQLNPEHRLTGGDFYAERG